MYVMCLSPTKYTILIEFQFFSIFQGMSKNYVWVKEYI